MSTRVLGTAYWYFSLVVVAVYTANLAAFLTSGRLATPIKSLSDLANQDAIPYGTVKESSLEAFFKVSSGGYGSLIKAEEENGG